MSDLFADRTPPQNIEAEQAVLGAIFLEPSAIVTASEILASEDFYRTAHQRIYAVMLDLSERGEPVDVVTVTAELQDRKLLDEAGGLDYLGELANSAPTAANIEFYSHIVEEKSLLRRLIRTATQIVSDGYTREDDVETILDDAEKTILEVSQRKRTTAFRSIKEILIDTYDNIEMLQNRKGDITGVPTGFFELDRMTAGFQKNDLIIVAARPSVGKTAFALNIAQNVATKTDENVAIFSLEMGAEQLVMRMLCAEGNIDAQKLRTGHLGEEDWQKLTMAMGSLSNAGIYIDDTPGIRVNEIRAKCRRLQQEKGLGLVLIDYLQLIQGSSTRRNENRQQEVSEISRTLKALARELNVPVIALSQLSRGVESRQDKRPMMSDIRESGCLSYDTLITRADTGERVEIGSLVGQENIPVLSLNDNLRLEVATISKVFSSGEKQLFELKTASGRTIKASSNHPFYTIGGWKAVSDLSIGERIAIARKVDEPFLESKENRMSQDELGLLAHLIGDGCVLAKQPIHYTSEDEENIKFVCEAANRLFGIEYRIVEQKTWKHVYLPSPYRLTHNKRHPITLWFMDLGIWNRRSYEKKVPEKVFMQTRRDIGWFLHHLWATDGSIYFKENRSYAYYATSSQILAKQVQHLLLRLGILSRLRVVPQGKYRDNYHVVISGKRMLLNFFENVGCFGGRGKRIQWVASELAKKKENPNLDIIPRDIWDYVSLIKDQHNKTWREVCAGLDTAYCGSTLFKSGLSKDRMLKLSKVLPDKKLQDLASSDIYWDEIISITPLDIQEVFDATVPGNHNFVANDFIVHNSIEQDADIVAFLYRDDYYDKESEKQNIIEIIISKQRNGPVGTVELAFVKEYNKFVNLERHHSENEIPAGQ
ncbi:replicative DNA helicase [Camelliibacillus cellulosilyticus]|uniref:Replicative DNA helicase n=1 Tax=Camelliibacillus cellulosilyticus TaxID=2174486 RepID=A0ABV9GNX2_9BACL